LESVGIDIERPVKIDEENTLFVCLTGSPKKFGIKTKSVFLEKIGNAIEVKITDPKCKYLITDSLDSNTSKMKTAKKNGIEIKTYGDF
jgi:hypothetical protein